MTLPVDPERDALVARIVAFLDRIGIETIAEPLQDTFLPGLTVRKGALVYDPAIPYPGDLLHEAGHIAVTEPALRPTLDTVSDNQAEEMAAMAWSYAAAIEIGIDPAIVFHDGGYRGASDNLREAFDTGWSLGTPMLQYYDMTGLPKDAERIGLPTYPRMARWLR